MVLIGQSKKIYFESGLLKFSVRYFVSSLKIFTTIRTYLALILVNSFQLTSNYLYQNIFFDNLFLHRHKKKES